MRSYGHFCGLARALDVVGDRWTLLIVRELLARGAARYTELQHGLPGIATNMLVNRLREMEESGLVEREELPPPVAATVFRLTPRGEALQDVIAAFGKWAAPMMAEGQGDDETRPHWLAMPIRFGLEDTEPEGAPAVLALQLENGETLIVEIGGGAIRTRVGTHDDADVVLEGSAAHIMGVLTKRMSLAHAKRDGLRVRGDAAVIQRLRRKGA